MAEAAYDVRTIEIAEGAEDLHPERLVAFVELGLEKIDQHVPLAWMQRVLPKLNDGPGRGVGWLCHGWPCEQRKKGENEGDANRVSHTDPRTVTSPGPILRLGAVLSP